MRRANDVFFGERESGRDVRQTNGARREREREDCDSSQRDRADDCDGGASGGERGEDVARTGGVGQGADESRRARATR
ncbi:hypothetical protein BE221DRAFT_79446 [Ostreococcus tauri]|uniref:Uncharacterized protein n=1 Tax=Ostreococcus tauri TaxID=70448 RepID=A0A1Y5I308_OSTTA|nr:hypothetical protein BE221DRAFT_79446 [Ostreococcus tauri]